MTNKANATIETRVCAQTELGVYALTHTRYYAEHTRVCATITAQLRSGSTFKVGHVSAGWNKDGLDDLEFHVTNRFTHLYGAVHKHPKNAQNVIDDIKSQRAVIEACFLEWYDETHFIDDGEKDNAIVALNEQLKAAQAQLAQAQAQAQPLDAETLLLKNMLERVQPELQTQATELAKELAKEHLTNVPRVVKCDFGDVVRNVGAAGEVVDPCVPTLCTLFYKENHCGFDALYLTGAAGAGKNIIARHMASAFGVQFIYSAQIQDVHEQVRGFMDALGNEHETPFIKAAREGGVLFIDEIDASLPDALVAINGMLSDHYLLTGWGEYIKCHEDLYIVCAGNTLGTGADASYNGRFQLDASTLDRFFVYEVNYNETVEDSISAQHPCVAEFVRAFRGACDSVGMRRVNSYRPIKGITNALTLTEQPESTVTTELLLRGSILKGLSLDDMRTLKNAMSSDIKDNALYKVFDRMCA